MEQHYCGYKRIEGNTDYINDYIQSIGGGEVEDQWYLNEYLIMFNTDTGKYSEMRFNGDTFVPLKLPPSKYIKGKNPEQRCALDMLANNDITICVLLGNYGSGKSFLSMSMALYAVQERGCQSNILGVREPIGEGRNLGYLPGDFTEKNEVWTLPLVQQLQGKEWQLDRLRQQGIIDFNIPSYMKGTSYSSTVMIIDEAEDLSKKQLKLIGTRVGGESRIFFNGDYRQSINKSDRNIDKSPLILMCEELKGNPLFACVTLTEDVRSETSKVFAELFEDE